MDQILDKYLDCIISYTKRNKTDSDKIRTELKDHLLKKIDDLKTQGLSQNEAVFKAIEDHGEPWSIGYKLRKKGFPARTLAGIACLLIVVFSFWVAMPAMGMVKRVLYPLGNNVIVFAGPSAEADLKIEPGNALTVLSANGNADNYVFPETGILLIGLPFIALQCTGILAVILIFKRTKKIDPTLA